MLKAFVICHLFNVKDVPEWNMVCSVQSVPFFWHIYTYTVVSSMMIRSPDSCLHIFRERFYLYPVSDTMFNWIFSKGWMAMNIHSNPILLHTSMVQIPVRSAAFPVQRTIFNACSSASRLNFPVFLNYPVHTESIWQKMSGYRSVDRESLFCIKFRIEFITLKNEMRIHLCPALLSTNEAWRRSLSNRSPIFFHSCSNKQTTVSTPQKRQLSRRMILFCHQAGITTNEIVAASLPISRKHFSLYPKKYICQATRRKTGTCRLP